MPMNERHGGDNEAPVLRSFSVMLSRVFWVFLGPAILLLSVIGIVESGSGWATGYDVVFCVVALLMVLARTYEQRSGQAVTTTGEAATWHDVRRWAFVFLPAALLTWAVANVVGNHLLPRGGADASAAMLLTATSGERAEPPSASESAA